MYWLGPDYQESGVAGNDIRRTNVPAIRIAYRYEALYEELRLLGNAYKSRQEVEGESVKRHYLRLTFYFFISAMKKIDVYNKCKPNRLH